MRELLLGCGSSRARRLAPERLANPKAPARGFVDLVTVDQVATHRPDLVHDLNVLPYPFPDDHFDEVHAYEVLEHLGRQGDAGAFLGLFAELWRILKPGGFLCATCPSWRSPWAWGDPSHTRVLSAGSLVFLDQSEYAKQVGVTAMSDFRSIYRADFRPAWIHEDADVFNFVLEAVKPSRWKAA